MCRHEFCPIKEGKCISEKPGWEWAEKFGLPEANPTQRQFLIEQSARWNEIVVHEGENRPNPVSGSACDDSKVVEEVPVVTAASTKPGGCGCGGKATTAIDWAKSLSEEQRAAYGITAKMPLKKLNEAFRRAATT